MTKERLNPRQFLEKQIGGTWIGVQFNTSARSGVECTNENMRICMAIREAAEGKHFILPNHQISCLGGCRSVGNLPNEEELVHHVSEATKLPIPTIQTLVKKTPFLTGIQSLEFGNVENPDVWISYCTPPIAMRLVRFWQIRLIDEIPFEISSFMATCGNVLAKSFLTNRLCLSLGCPTSRDFEYIKDNELVVGIPSRLFDSILTE